jgi:acetyl esterase/lipase
MGRFNYRFMGKELEMSKRPLTQGGQNCLQNEDGYASGMKGIAPAAILVAVLTAGASLGQPTTNQAPHRFPPPPGVKVLKDLQYGHGSGRPMLLDLYLPESTDKPRPLIIWIHGGAWMAGSKEDPSPALRFTTEDFAVAQVNYRLSQEAKFPAQIFDCKAAVRWLRANAAKYNLNANKFVAWGASAGGHLVALLGTSGGVPELEGNVNEFKESSRVQAVVDWFGPTDFLHIGEPESDLKHNAPDSPESRLIGWPLLEHKDLAAKASPITYVSKDAPPFLIMHGDHDRTVPFNQSELLYAALKGASVDVAFIPVKGAGHGFGGPKEIASVRGFLEQHLK